MPERGRHVQRQELLAVSQKSGTLDTLSAAVTSVRDLERAVYSRMIDALQRIRAVQFHELDERYTQPTDAENLAMTLQHTGESQPRRVADTGRSVFRV